VKLPFHRLLEDGELRPIDVEAARFIARLHGDSPATILELSTALLSKATREGHVCLPLSQLVQVLNQVEAVAPVSHKQLKHTLESSPVAGAPGTSCPLILDRQDKLYFYRYNSAEDLVAARLTALSKKREPIDLEQARHILTQLFPKALHEPGADLQYLATALSLFTSLLVLSGGPGTGKTYTVARILAAHAAIHPSQLRIRLAAPTGKAAARLKEAIRSAKQSLPAQLAASIPEEALTLHRLLRYSPHTRTFTHNHNNRLHLDLLLIDEASMIDISLMASLIKALPPTCKLLLLGDKNQLSSVDAGNLFGDICSTGELFWSGHNAITLETIARTVQVETTHCSPIDPCIVQLQKSYRFASHSGIGTLSSAIKEQDERKLNACLSASFPDLVIHKAEQNSLAECMRRFSIDHFAPILSSASPLEAIDHFDKSRILCSLRQGPFGVAALNSQVEQILAREKIIQPQELHYPGRPIMILHNDYTLNLFNGDTGVLWPNASGDLRAWFLQPDGNLCSYLPSRLPHHQTGYAITVHKSQGSEFENVLLVLPETDTPILTRELIYTAVTRAKEKLTIHAVPDIVSAAATRPGVRFSGLSQKLRPDLSR